MDSTSAGSKPLNMEVIREKSLELPSPECELQTPLAFIDFYLLHQMECDWVQDWTVLDSGTLIIVNNLYLA